MGEIPSSFVDPSYTQPYGKGLTPDQQRAREAHLAVEAKRRQEEDDRASLGESRAAYAARKIEADEAAQGLQDHLEGGGKLN